MVDALSYNKWAIDIVQNGWLGKSIFYQAPLYPYFIASVYKIFGMKIFAVRLVQVLLGSATCLFYYFIGKRLWNKKAGVVASLIACFYSIYIFYVPLVLKPILYLFLETLCILVLVMANKSNKNILLLVSGVILALMALTRENTIVIIAFFVMWVVAYYRRSGLKQILLKLILLFIGLFIVLFPVTVRNYVVGGDFVIATSQGGPNFYIGNNEKATGVYLPLVKGHQTPVHEGSDAKILAEKELGRTLKPSEVSKFWFRKSLGFILNNKLDYIKLMVRKVRLFFNYYEIPDAEDYYFYRRYSPLLAMPLISYGIICPLAIIGMIFCFRSFKEFSLIYTLAFANILSVVLFYIFSRYRLPIVPLFIIFASYGIIYLYDAIKRKDLYKVVSIGFLSVALYGFVYADMVPQRFNEAVSHFNIGESYRKIGEHEKALVEFEQAVALDPAYEKPYMNMAGIYFEKKKDYAKAIELWEKVVELYPKHFNARKNLAKAYMITEEVDRARVLLEGSVSLDCKDPEVFDMLKAIEQSKRRVPVVKKVTQRYRDDGTVEEIVEYVPAEDSILEKIRSGTDSNRSTNKN